MKTLHALRIIGHLLNNVRLNSVTPFLSYMQELISGLIEKSEFGTKTGRIRLIIYKGGDMSNQFMFENFEEVVDLISEIVVICFNELGDVEVSIKKSPGIKIIELIFEPMKIV